MAVRGFSPSLRIVPERLKLRFIILAVFSQKRLSLFAAKKAHRALFTGRYGIGKWLDPVGTLELSAKKEREPQLAGAPLPLGGRFPWFKQALTGRRRKFLASKR